MCSSADLENLFGRYVNEAAGCYFVPKSSTVQPPEFTHVLLSGGKFFVPHTNVDHFHQLLLDLARATVIDRQGPFTPCERIAPDVLKLAFDWDLKSQASSDTIEYVRDVVQFVQDELRLAFPKVRNSMLTIDIYSSKPTETFIETVKYVKNGYHIRFPYLIVSHPVAQVIYANLVQKLRSRFPRSYPETNTWDEAFDFALLRGGGLRMVGGDKCVREKRDGRIVTIACGRPLEYRETWEFKTSDRQADVKFRDSFRTMLERDENLILSLWRRSSIRVSTDKARYKPLVSTAPTLPRYWDIAAELLSFEVPTSWLKFADLSALPTKIGVVGAKKDIITRYSSRYSPIFNASSKEFDCVRKFVASAFASYSPLPIAPIFVSTSKQTSAPDTMIVKNSEGICPYASRQHKHNQTYFVLSAARSSPSVSLMCYDPECQSAISSRAVPMVKVPMPWDMVLLLFPDKIDPVTRITTPRTVSTTATTFAMSRFRSSVAKDHVEIAEFVTPTHTTIASSTAGESAFASAEHHWYVGNISECVKSVVAYLKLVACPDPDERRVKSVVEECRGRISKVIDDMASELASLNSREYTRLGF